MIKTQICSVCNTEQVITKRRALKFKNYIETTQCACGYIVNVIHAIDLDLCISSHPLPGYDRESVRQKFEKMGVALW